LLEQTEWFRGSPEVRSRAKKPRTLELAKANRRGSDAVLGSDLGPNTGHTNLLEKTGGFRHSSGVRSRAKNGRH
jgi:hypothetical protein